MIAAQQLRRACGLFVVLASSPFMAAPATGQGADAGIPDSVLSHMEQTVGVWVADNSAYRSDDEPFDQYALQWTWGVGQKSLIGRLYGITDGEESGTFWDFRHFWHPGEKAVVVQQHGWSGAFGTGQVTWLSPGESELVQTFYAPDGSSSRNRHLTHETATEHDGASFDWVDGEWQERRRYVWKKQ